MFYVGLFQYRTSYWLFYWSTSKIFLFELILGREIWGQLLGLLLRRFLLPWDKYSLNTNSNNASPCSLKGVKLSRLWEFKLALVYGYYLNNTKKGVIRLNYGRKRKNEPSLRLLASESSHASDYVWWSKTEKIESSGLSQPFVWKF